MKIFQLIIFISFALILPVALAFGFPNTFDFFSQTVTPGQKDQMVEQTAPPPRATTLVFVGDIMLSRHVGARMVAENNWLLPFEATADWLKAHDITFGNLESPFLNEGPRVTEGLSFKTEPAAVAGLIAAGFDVVSTANNHAFDRGLAGVTYTLKLLDDNGVKYSGTATSTAASPAAILKRNGKTFGFLAYSYFARKPYLAGMNIETMTSEVHTLTSTTDFVIVSMHAGEEYTRQPSAQQVEFAHAAIDAGADIVVGHHPHWIQPVEKYRDGLIFYSLGNFVFDQEWSQETKEGLTVEVTIEPDGKMSYTLKPVLIEGYCCPSLLPQTESETLLEKLNLR